MHLAARGLLAALLGVAAMVGTARAGAQVNGTGWVSTMQSPRYELRDPGAGRYRVLVHRAVRSWLGGRYYCESHWPGGPTTRLIVTDSATGRILPTEVVDSAGARACGVQGPASGSWLRVALPRTLTPDEWFPLVLDRELEDREILRQRGDTLEFIPWASPSGEIIVLPAGYSLLPVPNVRDVDTLPDGRTAVHVWQPTAVPSRLEVKAVRRRDTPQGDTSVATLTRGTHAAAAFRHPR